MHNIIKQISFLGLALILGSCSVGPDYERPTVVVPEQFKEASKDWKIAEPQEDNIDCKWWEVFNDPVLNDLEEQLDISNQTIVSFEAQYRQAIALVDQAIAAYFPTIGANSAITRQKLSQNASTSTFTTSPKPFTDYTASLTATWAPDLFGVVRRNVEAFEDAAEASEAQLAGARLTAQASLAQIYFQLRTLDVIQKALDDTVASYEKTLTLTKNRFAQGVAGQSDVLLSLSLLQSAQAQAIDNKILRDQYEHAIAVLIGEAPANFTLDCNKSNLNPPSIPLLLPSELLERRPDIAQTERLVAQANANIGLAVAAYFPLLNLGATGGYDSHIFATWFSAPALFWSIGPQLTATLFDGGLRDAKLEGAEATYDQTVANYRQTVLTAFQDVEDNLTSLNILKDEAKVQDAALATSRKALEILLNQYKSGTASMSDVITAEVNTFAAQKNALTIAGRRMTAAVGLIKALGGGWKVPPTN